MDYQATTLRLRADVYERLRLEAFEKRTSQNAIVNAELAERYGLPVGEEAPADG